MSNKKTKKQVVEIEPTDLITLDKAISVNVNSNVYGMFTEIVAGKGLNNSIVIRQFLLDYVKKGMNEQQDLFPKKGS